MEADVAHSQQAWNTQGHQKLERATSGNFGRSRAQSAPHFRFLVSKTENKLLLFLATKADTFVTHKIIKNMYTLLILLAVVQMAKILML